LKKIRNCRGEKSRRNHKKRKTREDPWPHGGRKIQWEGKKKMRNVVANLLEIVAAKTLSK